MTFNKEERIGVFSIAKIFVEDFEWIFREQPINDFGIDAFVEIIINKQIEEEQFLNANITFKEIESIKKILKRKLANIYHLRIEYPE